MCRNLFREGSCCHFTGHTSVSVAWNIATFYRLACSTPPEVAAASWSDPPHKHSVLHHSSYTPGSLPSPGPLRNTSEQAVAHGQPPDPPAPPMPAGPQPLGSYRNVPCDCTVHLGVVLQLRPQPAICFQAECPAALPPHTRGQLKLVRLSDGRRTRRTSLQASRGRPQAARRRPRSLPTRGQNERLHPLAPGSGSAGPAN